MATDVMCVHCNKPIGKSEVCFVYTESKQPAHIRCVSQPSAAETDSILKMIFKGGKHAKQKR